jgi:hypothetical protein
MSTPSVCIISKHSFLLPRKTSANAHFQRYLMPLYISSALTCFLTSTNTPILQVNVQTMSHSLLMINIPFKMSRHLFAFAVLLCTLIVGAQARPNSNFVRLIRRRKLTLINNTCSILTLIFRWR